MTVDQLQWYAGALPDTAPTRKGELVALLARVLGDNGRIRALLSQLTPVQQQVLAEVAYGQTGRYDAEVIEAKYPDSKAPKNPRRFGYGFYSFGSQKKEYATPFELFFFYSYDAGLYIPPDLAALDQEGWVIRVGTFSKIPKTPIHAVSHCVALSA
jgi:hypothetical protein